MTLAASGQGGGVNYNPNPSSPALNNGLPMPNGGAGPAAPSSGTTDPDDPSLERLKSSDSLGQGTMSRDDGQLTAKVRRREKVSRVESTKQLPTSGIDSKFQGSLLHSSVSSITDVGEKAASHATATEAESSPAAEDESDPRFKARRLVFTPMTKDESKTHVDRNDSSREESPRTKEDSSPSPSPSPSASVTPSSH